MSEIPREFAKYLSAVRVRLESSPNQFLQQHPEIGQRIAAADWRVHLDELENSFRKIYAEAKPGFAVGTAAFDLDDCDFDRVSIAFSASNEYAEWMEYDEDGYEVDLATVIDAIFAGIPDWSEELRDDLDVVQGLLQAFVELAAIASVANDAFAKICDPNGFILVSSVWHDVEKTLFFDSTGDAGKAGRAVDYPPEPLEFTPVNIENTASGIITILGQETKLSARVLRTDRVGFGSLPAEIGLLTNLEEVEFVKERLAELPDSFFGLSKLTKVNLQNNQFKDLSDDIGRLTQLTELNLRENRLTKLPDAIALLKNLVRLSAEYNVLESLPANLEQLDQLEDLSLYNNRLTSLPALPRSLTWLNLNENLLTELPDSFRDLTQLDTLVLSGNRFTSIPPQLFELPALSSLEIGGNAINDLPDALLNLSELIQIRVYPNAFPVDKRARLREKFGDRLFVGYDSDPKSFTPVS